MAIKKRKRVGEREFGASGAENDVEGKTCHITVERNRRKQMNENLAILRSLMPSFYVKKGDQASIVGGVVEYVVELQQIHRSLESKKYRNLLLPTPRVTFPSPKPAPIFSSLKLDLLTPTSTSSHVLTMPFSPATPQREVMKSLHSTSYVKNEVLAQVKSETAVVDVKLSGPHLVLKTVSRSILGQAAKIVQTLKQLSLEALHVSINKVDEATVISYFTLKIGFDCQLCAEEVAQQVLQTFH